MSWVISAKDRYAARGALTQLVAGVIERPVRSTRAKRRLLAKLSAKQAKKRK